MMKILIIRFSSIGDIVLTSPVVRTLSKLEPKAEIHFITKAKFAPTLENSPYISKLYTFKKEITEILPQLKSESYDYIIDLHSNLRSRRLKLALGTSIKTKSFHKLNYRKWFKVNLKYDLLPDIHIVDRYMDTLKSLGVKNDDLGLDYFITEKDREALTLLPNIETNAYHVLVIGGTHYTKQIPIEKCIEIVQQSNLPIVLVGGPEDVEKGRAIEKETGKNVFNSCGQFSLNESAAIIEGCCKVITSDTGMMHIAAAFKKEIISVWGNTIPEFGMYPYFPTGMEDLNRIFEVKGLKCRPCSKIGFKECPKKHFDCMNKINYEHLMENVNP